MLLDDVVQGVDLCLNGVVHVLDLEIDATCQRPLCDRDLRDTLHLLPPVIAEEVVREVDRVLLRRVRRRGVGARARGEDRDAGEHRPSDKRRDQATMHVMPPL
jgi:hypothetical protein